MTHMFVYGFLYIFAVDGFYIEGRGNFKSRGSLPMGLGVFRGFSKENFKQGWNFVQLFFWGESFPRRNLF